MSSSYTSTSESTINPDGSTVPPQDSSTGGDGPSFDSPPSADDLPLSPPVDRTALGLIVFATMIALLAAILYQVNKKKKEVRREEKRLCRGTTSETKQRPEYATPSGWG